MHFGKLHTGTDVVNTVLNAQQGRYVTPMNSSNDSFKCLATTLDLFTTLRISSCAFGAVFAGCRLPESVARELNDLYLMTHMTLTVVGQISVFVTRSIFIIYLSMCYLVNV